jgi:aminoglycoside phosphotransferase (APT) family kinase protein
MEFRPRRRVPTGWRSTCILNSVGGQVSVRQMFPTERFVDRALSRKSSLLGNLPYRKLDISEVKEQLNRFLSRRLHGPFSVSDVRPLAGGACKEQFSFSIHGQSAELGAPDRPFVLRLQPDGSIAETHRLREFQVMNAIRGAVPVPEALWVDPEAEEFSRPALIARFIEGVSRPPADGQMSGARQGFGARYRGLIAPQFIAHLAAIGLFDWRKSDLSSFDVPAAGTSQAVIWAVNWWRRVWTEDSIEACPLMTVAAQWLVDNAPPVDRISVVHADYRGGNFLFRPDDGTITAILDWELAHLGDRHEDLAYIMNPIFAEEDENGQLMVGGLCPRSFFLEEYERLSGLRVDPKRLHYYEVFCNFRNVAMGLAAAGRITLNQMTHQDILVGLISLLAPVNLAQLHASLQRGE